jgi:secreted protein with Ig-like and vWFA domain
LFDFIAFDHPWWLLLWPVLAAAVVLLGWRWLVTVEPARRWIAITLRLVVLALVVLMLAGLQAVQTHDNLTVIALMDHSESVRRFATPPAANPDAPAPRSVHEWAQGYLRQAAKQQGQGDRFGWVRYDARPSIERMPEKGINLQAGATASAAEGTDTAAAIRTGMALFPADSGARLVLVSDGNDTNPRSDDQSAARSDLMAAVQEAKAAGIPIDVVPLNYNIKKEAMVEGVYAPTEARRGQTVQVRVVLRATQPMRGQVQLLHDGAMLDLNGDRPGKGAPVSPSEWTRETRATVNKPAHANDDANNTPANQPTPNEKNNQQNITGQPGRFVTVKPIELPLAYAGVNQFEAVFEPEQAGPTDADRIAANNAARGFTIVHGKGRGLFVSNEPDQQGAILPAALRDRGIDLDVIRPSALPAEMAQLQRYDAVILQNTPAERVTVPQQKMLARYVNDLGGGFLMVGGPKSFGAGGWTNSPVDRILPVDCQIPSQTVLPSGALALVIDRSGSMAGQKQRLANEAAVLALKTLYPQDRISVVAFDNSAKRVVQLQPNADPAGVAEKVRSIESRGGTNIYAGLEAAYDELAPLKTQDAAVKHIILLTDGHSQQGNAIDLARKMTQAGISLSTVGVGQGKRDAFLQQIAQMTGGRYHPINNPNNLPQVFIKEARTIRKNLIKEEPFDPAVYPSRSPITTGLGDVPSLKGLVLTGEKNDPRVFMPIRGQEGEPVFAHWQVGLGRAAAFTSDATTRWAGDWVQWPGYAEFWAAVVRRIARPSRSQNADLMTHIEGGTLHVRLDASTREQNQRFANFLSVKGSVLKPDQSTEPLTLQQTGPGVYETTLSAPADGNYIVNLFVKTQDGQRRAVFGGATKSRGNELRRFQSNDALLKRIAKETGGRVLSPADATQANLFSRERSVTTRSIQPMWRSLLIAALVLLLLDVANRRVAWEPQAVWAWSKGRAAALGTLMKSRRVESERTLGALKTRRAQTQQQHQPQAQPAQPEADPNAPQAPSRKQRFDLGKRAKPNADFTQAVGGATEGADGQTSQPSAQQTTATDEPEDQSTSSRLRAAKQRSRQRMQRDDEA